MFKRIKNWIGRAPDAGHSRQLQAVQAWAATQSLAFEALPADGDFALAGRLGHWPWRLERGAPAREFIVGAELRARAELAVSDDVAVMVINRPLKDELEKHAYDQATHGVQTALDGGMTDELRFLALYDEVGWASAPMEFWDRYAIVAESRAQAQEWLDDRLLQLLLAWPTPAVQQMTPFMLQVQRGRVYLRMEYPQTELATLQHAVAVFTQASVSARALWAMPGFSRPAPL